MSAFLMLLPIFEKKVSTLSVMLVDLGFAGAAFFLEAAACGGGVVEIEVGVGVGVVGAATAGEAVPAVVPLEVAVDPAATTPTRSGLGSAVPRMVAGAGVLGVGLVVPKVADAAVLGVTVPAGVRLDGAGALAVAVVTGAWEGVGAEGSLDTQSTVTCTPLTSAVLVADTTGVVGVA